MSTFIKHIYLLRNNLREAEQMNSKLKNEQPANTRLQQDITAAIITVPRLLNKITLDEFIYAESKGNNLLIQCKKDNELISHSVRCTLNEFSLANANNSRLFRCHRSFIINTDKIIKVEGNAAGYVVSLHPRLPEIVVARSNVEAFKKILQDRR